MTTTILNKAIEIVKDPWRRGDEDTAYIGLEHIGENTLSLVGVGRSVKLESNKFRFRKGDVLFGKLRPYFRKVVRPDFDGVCSTDIWVMRAKEGFDQGYIFYFVANPDFIAKSTGASTGTKMPRADWDFLGNTTYWFPSLDKQRSIAAILSSLDNKIELLRKQNETLEQIVQAVFNEWFESSSHTVATLSDYVAHIKEQVLPAATPTGTFYHYSIPAFDTDKTPSVEVGASILSGKYRVESNSILYSKLNPATPRVWTVFSAPANAICSTEFQVFKSKDTRHLPFIYAVLRFSSAIRTLTASAQGTSSSHQRLRPDDILTLEFPVSDEKTLDAYNDMAGALLRKINRNKDQIQSLIGVRDTLLPRLMSGEIRI